ncbi:MAG: hypothetical protein ACI4DY_14805 [Monoglobaceae bacterium]
MPKSFEEKERVLENIRKRLPKSIVDCIHYAIEYLPDDQLMDPNNLKSLYTKINISMNETPDSSIEYLKKCIDTGYYIDSNLSPNSMTDLAQLLNLTNAGLSKIINNIKTGNQNQNIKNLRWFLECISLTLVSDPYYLLGIETLNFYGSHYKKKEGEHIIPFVFLSDRINVQYVLTHNLADTEDEKRKKAYKYIIMCNNLGQEKKKNLYALLNTIAIQKGLNDDIDWKAIPEETHIKDKALEKLYSSNPDLVKLFALYSRSDEYIDILIFLFERCGFLDDKRRIVQND